MDHEQTPAVSGVTGVRGVRRFEQPQESGESGEEDRVTHDALRLLAKFLVSAYLKDRDAASATGVPAAAKERPRDAEPVR